MIEALYQLVQIITAIAGLTVVPLAWLVWKIRANDLEHISGKLEDIRSSLMRLEEKTDQHIQWHLETKHE